MCMGICVYVHAEAGGQPQVSSLGMLSTLFCEMESLNWPGIHQLG